MIDIVMCRIPADWLTNPSQCWYDWQGLISGLLALGAAIWAGRQINKQIRLSEKLATEQLQRQHNAARIALPLALSAIVNYCQQTAADILDTIDSIGAQSDSDAPQTPLPFGSHTIPDDAIALIYKFVETLDNQQEAKHVAELVAQLQIFQGRFETMPLLNRGIPDSLYGLFLTGATVRFLTESMLNYVRLVDNTSFAQVRTISDVEAWDGIQLSATGLFFSRPYIDGYAQEVGRLIQRYQGNGASPWLKKFER